MDPVSVSCLNEAVVLFEKVSGELATVVCR